MPRRDHDGELEFVAIMTFDSTQSVIEFQGEDYEVAYVPPAARKVLKRWDSRSAHFVVLDQRTNPGP